jgi:hypothetical protein
MKNLSGRGKSINPGACEEVEATAAVGWKHSVSVAEQNLW